MSKLFLFILESIGTPELILIAIVALIILGPRKLPQMAKTVAKTMGEFKNATNEFKSTWEKEVAFEEEVKPIERTASLKESVSEIEYSINQNTPELLSADPFLEPEIKELSAEEIAHSFKNQEKITEKNLETKNEVASEKQNWL